MGTKLVFQAVVLTVMVLHLTTLRGVVTLLCHNEVPIICSFNYCQQLDLLDLLLLHTNTKILRISCLIFNKSKND